MYNINPDGHRLRTNAVGRSKNYQIGRLSQWDVRYGSNLSTPNKDMQSREYIENNIFRVDHHPSAFNANETAKMIELIDSFIKNHSYSCNFLDAITDELAPDYLNLIPVEMNLYKIRYFLDSEHYRSKEMLLNDIKLIKDNCAQFNGENEKISKEAKQVYENLKKIFEKFWEYGFRNAPTRSSARNVIKSQTSDSQEANLNKRNPRKVDDPPLKRSTRKRAEVNYNEKTLEESKFKIPTPTKSYKRYKDDEDSEVSHENANFVIVPPRVTRNLSRMPSSSLESGSNSRNLRRSNRTPVTHENERVTRTTRRRDIKYSEKENKSLERVVNSRASNKRSRRKQSNSESDFGPVYKEDSEEFEPDDY